MNGKYIEKNMDALMMIYLEPESKEFARKQHLKISGQKMILLYQSEKMSRNSRLFEDNKISRNHKNLAE
jgi:hypothetical protein